MSLPSPPSHVLTELLAEHEALRELMTSCERLADELDGGRIGPEALTREIARLRVAFDAHNRNEEQFLRPLLASADAFGDVRVDRMVADHIDEHRIVREGLGNEVTGQLRLALDHLRAHLVAEERYFVTSKVLRDDVVVVESGA